LEKTARLDILDRAPIGRDGGAARPGREQQGARLAGIGLRGHAKRFAIQTERIHDATRHGDLALLPTLVTARYKAFDPFQWSWCMHRAPQSISCTRIVVYGQPKADRY
jgi:hypothetical protein